MPTSFFRHTTAAVFVTLAIASSSLHAQEPHIAFLKDVRGTVEVMRQGQKIAAKSGMRLYVSDRLMSGAGASAGMVFRDGTALTMGASADLSLRAYVFQPKQGEYAFDAYLAKGTALYSSGKIAKMSPDAVKVGTPTATVGVRGTRFIIEAE
jgi:hypothetical protein